MKNKYLGFKWGEFPNSFTVLSYASPIYTKSGNRISQLLVERAGCKHQFLMHMPNVRMRQIHRCPICKAIKSPHLSRVYGRWKVIGGPEYRNYTASYGQNWWLCECQCSSLTKRWVRENCLIEGYSESCGCKSIEELSKLGKSQVGKLHPRYTGQTSIIKTLRSLPEYVEWRSSVFERDNYICQLSKQSYSGRLQAHHIKPVYQILRDNDISSREEVIACDELWDISNGITLLDCWHLQGPENSLVSFHNLYGCVNFTKEDFYDWFEKYEQK